MCYYIVQYNNFVLYSKIWQNLNQIASLSFSKKNINQYTHKSNFGKIKSLQVKIKNFNIYWTYFVCILYPILNIKKIIECDRIKKSIKKSINIFLEIIRLQYSSFKIYPNKTRQRLNSFFLSHEIRILQIIIKIKSLKKCHIWKTMIARIFLYFSY